MAAKLRGRRAASAGLSCSPPSTAARASRLRRQRSAQSSTPVPDVGPAILRPRARAGRCDILHVSRRPVAVPVEAGAGMSPPRTSQARSTCQPRPSAAPASSQQIEWQRAIGQPLDLPMVICGRRTIEQRLETGRTFHARLAHHVYQLRRAGLLRARHGDAPNHRHLDQSSIDYRCSRGSMLSTSDRLNFTAVPPLRAGS